MDSGLARRAPRNDAFYPSPIEIVFRPVPSSAYGIYSQGIHNRLDYFLVAVDVAVA
jgi:hypothetical protein